MRWVIEHESPQRLRVQAQMSAMSGSYADALEAYLTDIAGITGVRVDERTANACIGFERGQRDELEPDAADQHQLQDDHLVQLVSDPDGCPGCFPVTDDGAAAQHIDHRHQLEKHDGSQLLILDSPVSYNSVARYRRFS